MNKFNLALTLAMDAHEGQIRKGTENKLGVPVPYISHPVAVASLVVRYDGDEDQVIAALLHDVLEDGNPEVDWVSRISVFGDRVLRIVESCTDGKPDPATGKKALWRDRKELYLDHLKDATPDVLLVSACDKLNNLQAIHLDLVETGLSVFDRFSAGRDDVLWYYRTLCEIFTKRGVVVAGALCKELVAVEAKVKELQQLELSAIPKVLLDNPGKYWDATTSNIPLRQAAKDNRYSGYADAYTTENLVACLRVGGCVDIHSGPFDTADKASYALDVRWESPE